MLVDGPTLLGYSLTVAAIVLSPGPDTVLILRNSLSGGQRAGFATVLGVQLGLIGHTLLAILGISVLIASSPIAFKTVAILGAAYLAYIGVQGFRGQTLRFDHDSQKTIPLKKAVVDAMVCNLLNPKVIILFLALLPNFVHPEKGSVSLQLVILAIVLVAINIIWQAPLAWAAHSIRRWIARPRVQRTINITTGIFLIAFAGAMLWEHIF